MLNINLHTANKAYAILQAEGFVKVHKREGFIVKDPEDLRATADHVRSIEERLRPITAEAVCRGISEREFAQICRRVYDAVKSDEVRK